MKINWLALVESTACTLCILCCFLSYYVYSLLVLLGYVVPFLLYYVLKRFHEESFLVFLFLATCFLSSTTLSAIILFKMWMVFPILLFSFVLSYKIIELDYLMKKSRKKPKIVEVKN